MIFEESNLPVIKNLSLISIGAILGTVFTFLANIIFARYLNLYDFGVLASSFVAINLYVSFVGFGIGLFWLNIYGTEGLNGKNWLKPSLKIIFILICFSIFLIILSLFYSNNSFNKLVFILIPWMLGLVLNDLAAATLQLQKKFQKLSLWLLFPHLSKIIIAIFLGIMSFDLIAVGSGIAFMGMTMMTLSLFQLVKFYKKENFIKINLNTYKEPSIIDTLKKAWPFCASGFFYFIFFQTNIVILYWLNGPEASGIYYAALMISIAIFIIPSSIFQKYILPLQHRWARENPLKLLAVFRFTCGTMILLGITATIMLILIAQTSIFNIFGEEFFKASEIIFILAFGVPFKFLAIGIGGLLSVRDLIKTKIKCMGIIAFLNVILNFSLVPIFSLQGAAFATIICDLCLLIFYLIVIQNKLFGSDTWKNWNISIKSIQNL